MSILQRLSSLIFETDFETKATKSVGMQKAVGGRSWLPNRPLSPLSEGANGINRLITRSDFIQAGTISAFVYACMNLRASTVAKYPIRGLGPDNTEVFGPSLGNVNRKHPLYRLMQRPNPFQSQYQFIYMISMYLDALGVCLVFMDDIDLSTGQPHSLWPLDPSRCEPVVNGGLVGYKYTMLDGGDPLLLPLDVVVPFIVPRPGNMYWGMGRIEAIAKDINIHAAVTEYVSQFFNQGAQPSGILHTSKDLSNDAFDRLKEEVAIMMTGMRNMHRLPVLDNDLQYQPLAATLDQLGTKDLEEITMRKILTAFEVPGTKFGLSEFMSYKAEDMEKSWLESMQSHAAIFAAGFDKLAGLYQSDGKAVPDNELNALKQGRVLEDAPTGCTMMLVIPSSETIGEKLQNAQRLQTIKNLSPEEQRRGTIQLVGDLVRDTSDPLVKEFVPEAPAPAALPAASNTNPAADPGAATNTNPVANNSPDTAK